MFLWIPCRSEAAPEVYSSVEQGTAQILIFTLLRSDGVQGRRTLLILSHGNTLSTPRHPLPERRPERCRGAEALT